MGESNFPVLPSSGLLSTVCVDARGLLFSLHSPLPHPDFSLQQGLCFYYWGLFDGHAGGGAAEMASRLLHRHIGEQLRDLVEILQEPSPPPLCLPSTPGTPGPSDPAHLVGPQSCWPSQKEVTQESLVVGAIENAFQLMVSGGPGPGRGLPGRSRLWFVLGEGGGVRWPEGGDPEHLEYL